MSIEPCEVGGLCDWQHCKFIENSKERFAMAFYCRKCLRLLERTYPPLSKKEMKK